MHSYGLTLAALAGFALSGLIFAGHIAGPINSAPLVMAASE